jgi:mRNA-degrading endonuclease RelE of RelBE toxin-antitoxin system
MARTRGRPVNHIRVSTRASKDLRRIGPGPELDRLEEAIENLVRDPPLPTLDIKPLVGRGPWRRLRVSDYRIVFRPITREELGAASRTYQQGVLIERVIHRRDLEKAAKSLP